MPLLAWFVLFCSVAFGHPYGSSLYGHRTQVWLDRGQVRVAYLAEVPTPDLLKDLRAYLSGNPDPGPADQAAFTERWLRELQDGLQLTVDGQRVPWERLSTDQPSGVGDSRFIQFHLSLSAPLPDDTRTLDLLDNNMLDEPSLYSTELYVTDALVVDASSLFEVDGGRLKGDRHGQWRMEEENRELRVSFHWRSDLGERVHAGFRKIGSDDDTRYLPADQALSTVQRSPLQELVTGALGLRAIVIGLLLAVVLGAAHGLSPGHGKTLVAAYLLGGRETVAHAVWLGVIVTVTHTLGVYALAALAWLLEETAPPEVLLPWMELASGVLVLGVGVGLVRSRWRGARGRGGTHTHGGPHTHADGTTHSHAGTHSHPGGVTHSHDFSGPAAEAAHAMEHAQQYEVGSFRDIVLLGVSGGLAPCPTALVLLLTALSFHRLGLGLVLVLAFSLGLALLVTGIGVTVVLAGDRLRRWGSLGQGSRLLRALPLVSAIVVAILGLVMSWRGVLSVLGG